MNDAGRVCVSPVKAGWAVSIPYMRNACIVLREPFCRPPVFLPRAIYFCLFFTSGAPRLCNFTSQLATHERRGNAGLGAASGRMPASGSAGKMGIIAPTSDIVRELADMVLRSGVGARLGSSVALPCP